jgi:hypothetical protein
VIKSFKLSIFDLAILIGNMKKAFDTPELEDLEVVMDYNDYRKALNKQIPIRCEHLEILLYYSNMLTELNMKEDPDDHKDFRHLCNKIMLNHNTKFDYVKNTIEEN